MMAIGFMDKTPKNLVSSHYPAVYGMQTISSAEKIDALDDIKVLRCASAIPVLLKN
jgi:hypothetical protein